MLKALKHQRERERRVSSWHTGKEASVRELASETSERRSEV